VKNLPKRKLWFSKNDYKKEREEELARLAKIAQEEDLKAQQPAAEAIAEPASNESNTQPVEAENTTVPVETSLSSEDPVAKAEREMKEAVSGTEGNMPPTGTLPPTIENQAEIAEKKSLEETAPANEPAEAPSETTELTPFEAEPKDATVQAEEIPIQIEDDIQPAPTEPQTIVQAQNQTEQIEVPVVPIEIPVTAEPENKPAEAVTEEGIEEAAIPIPLTNSVQSIEKFTDSLKTLLPTRAIVSIGEYPINILINGGFTGKKGVLPIFVEKSSKDVIKWGQGHLDKSSIVCLDEDIDTHFWYDIVPYLADNEGFLARIKAKPLEKIQGAIIVSATWNGVGATLLPTLNSKFKEWNINTISLALLPSKAQPLDGQFNSLASLGILASKENTTAILIDRDNLEAYTGNDSNGIAIEGNNITNYLLDLMLSKETFARELTELSKSFSTKMFAVMLAPGMSLKLYGTLENMLNTTLVRPLLTFDLSTSTLLYVLIRVPFHLKDKFPRGKIELSVANWFKDKANLESIFIADPVIGDDSGDRIDIAMFIGGFDTATRFAALETRVERMKNKAVKKGSITEEDWQSIAKGLVE
jgi:hypothetical protein